MTGRHARADDYCPRCGSELVIPYGAQLGCGHCGATWQADVIQPERIDQPSRIDTLRHLPLNPRERFQARRSLDERTG